jgi:dihydrofolate reductase
MRENLVDELYLTIVPKLFGRGVGLFTSDLQANLTLLEITPLTDGALLLHYAVKR